MKRREGGDEGEDEEGVEPEDRAAVLAEIVPEFAQAARAGGAGIGGGGGHVGHQRFLILGLMRP